MIRALATLGTLALLTAPLPVLAADATWELLGETGGCTVSLVPEMVDDGIFFVDRGTADCGPDIARITGYALNNDGTELVLYSTLDGVDQLGLLTRESEGLYRGSLRNGTALRLEHKSGPKGIADPRTGLMTGEDVAPALDTDAETTPPTPEFFEDETTAAPGNCLTYAGGSACVAPEDMGAPEGGSLQTLSRMNLRDIGGTTGSRVVGQAEGGTCFQVSLCQEDAEGRLWCSVLSDDLQGWLLKQDDSTVYSRNSCL